MDLESLAIFKTVVEEGEVVRAAEKLHRVPSLPGAEALVIFQGPGCAARQ